MQTDTYKTIIEMPDSSTIHATYYCDDFILNGKSQPKLADLIIQLDDCICTVKVDRSVCQNSEDLDTLVHYKVINTKGHLC